VLLKIVIEIEIGMVRSELIGRVAAANPTLTVKQVEQAVDLLIQQIENAMRAGQRVELRGFGISGTKLRKARAGKNPRTGTDVHILEKRLPLFKSSKELRRRLNPESLPSTCEAASLAAND
jgi:integration host factor subunit beta